MRRGAAAFVHSLIWLMVVKPLAGKQMLFCEMDRFFSNPAAPPTQSLSAAEGAKSTSNMWVGARLADMDTLERQHQRPFAERLI